MIEQTIEKLKEQNNRLTSALENVMDGVAVFNTSHELVYTNKTWASIHGFEVMEVLGKKSSDFFSGEIYDRYFVPMIAEAEKCDRVAIETVQLRKDGTPFQVWMEISCTKDKGNTTGYSMTIRDLTEQKQVEFDIEQKMKSAEKLNKVMVNRELKMVELKNKITELEEELVKAKQ